VSGIIISDKFVHSSKAPSLIVVTVSGITTFFKEEQFLNTAEPISFNCFGNVISESDTQFSKV